MAATKAKKKDPVPALRAELNKVKKQLAGKSPVNLLASQVVAGNVAAAAIVAGNLAASSVNAGAMQASSVTTSALAADSVTSAKIAANTITADDIAAGTITATTIAAGTITGDKIAAGTITATNIAATTITAAQIAAGTITATQIQAGSINSDRLYSGSIQAQRIQTNNLAANIVTANEIAANTITAGQLAANSVTTTILAADSVTSAKIAANTITAADIAAGTITAMEIASATITASKIVSGTITATQIAASTITGSLIAAGTITATNISSGTITSTQIQAGSINSDRLYSGAVQAQLIQTANLAAGSITAAVIAANTITASQIASATITATQIAASTITGSLIAATTITASNIASATITATQIASGTITATQIAASTITGGLIAAGTVTATNIAAATITGSLIAAATITGTLIASATIDSTKISVSSLSALSANLGSITAGTITGATFQTSTGTARVQMDSTGIFAKDTGNADTFRIDAATGNVTLKGTLSTGSAADAALITSGTLAAARLPAIGGGNLLTNSSAEGGVTEYAASVGAVSQSSTKARHGTYSALLTATGANAIIQRAATAGGAAPIQADGTYTASIWIYCASARAYSIVARAYDSGFVTPTDSGAATGNLTAAGWTRLVVTYTVPAGNAYLLPRVTFTNSVNGDLFYADEWQIEEGAVATAYAPKPDEILPSTVATSMVQANAITTGLLAANAVGSGQLANAAVGTTQLASGAVTSSILASGSVTSTAIATGAVTSAGILDGTIAGGDVAAATLTGSNLAAATIAGSNIAAVTITSGLIASAAITNALIASGAVNSTSILDGSVTGTDVASATIAGANIAASTITGSLIAAGTVTATNIAAATITGSLIAAATIGASNLIANTITAGQIAAATITGTQIAANTIAAANVAADTLTANEIAASAIGTSELAANAVTAAKIAANTITAAQIAAGTITATEIAAATITGAKIAATTIAAGNIISGTITATQLATDSVTTTQILANTILAGDIASATITGTQIAATTITAGNIASGTITATQIASGTITADRMSVTQLSAIAADLGSITAGTITGGLHRTAASGARVEVSGTNNNLAIYDSGGTSQVTLDGTNGLVLTAYATTAFPAPVGTPNAVNTVEWKRGSTVYGRAYNMYIDTAGSSTIESYTVLEARADSSRTNRYASISLEAIDSAGNDVGQIWITGKEGGASASITLNSFANNRTTDITIDGGNQVITARAGLGSRATLVDANGDMTPGRYLKAIANASATVVDVVQLQNAVNYAIGNGVGLNFSLKSSPGPLGVVAAIEAVTVLSPSVTKLTFSTDDGSGLGERMSIDSSGNIAINRSLTVASNATVSGNATITGTTTLSSSVVTATALSNRAILEVGVVNQIRAGRELVATDFTTLLGLSTPAGLWDAGSLVNLGSGGDLTNKGSVPLTAKGINGTANHAALFAGSTAQALYKADTGAGDPFRLKTFSWGCWTRTAKRGTAQFCLSKDDTGGTRGPSLGITTGNVLEVDVFSGATLGQVVGITDLCDDRWHFIAGTYDGSVVRGYVDGQLESSVSLTGTSTPGAAPFTIGGRQTAGLTVDVPHFGRIAAPFVIGDVLNESQIRMLMAAKVAHGYSVTPTIARLAIRSKRRGGPYVVGDFTATPKVLYNFTAAALTDAGSLGSNLTNNNAAVSVAGADGQSGGAFQLNGTTQYLSATDTGLPSGTAASTIIGWFKAPIPGGSSDVISYGTTGGRRQVFLHTDGKLYFFDNTTQTISAMVVGDNQWHFFAVVIDNAAADGQKVKLYIDGRATAGSTALASGVLNGTLAIGRDSWASSNFFPGTIDGIAITDYAMAQDEITSLYAKGSAALGAKPSFDDDRGLEQIVQAMDATNIYMLGDAAKRIGGKINSDGSIAEAVGGDFRAVRSSTGVYVIYFPPGFFSSPPMVTVSAEAAGRIFAEVDAGTTAATAQLRFFDSAGTANDRNHFFIAEGRGPLEPQHALDLKVAA